MITLMSYRNTLFIFIVFCSGPLPLTSLRILKVLGKCGAQTISIQNIDLDPRAISTSCDFGANLAVARLAWTFAAPTSSLRQSICTTSTLCT